MSYLARAPLRPLFLLRLIRVETEGFLDYQGQGRAGMIPIVRWTLCPVVLGVEFWTSS